MQPVDYRRMALVPGSLTEVQRYDIGSISRLPGTVLELPIEVPY